MFLFIARRMSSFIGCTGFSTCAAISPPRTGSVSIKQPDLDEHRSLVPVDVLVSHLVALELHDGDHRDRHALAGRRDAGQKPVEADGVRESQDQFIDDPALPDGPRDGNRLGVRWEL